MNNCQGCGSTHLKKIIDFGLLPISNQFKINTDRNDFLSPLILKQCQTCALIQIRNTIPLKEMIPKVDWIKYREPEDHLDTQAEIICNILDQKHIRSACGITYKDKSFLDRLSKKGFKGNWIIDPLIDLNILQKGVASETILPKLTKVAVRTLIEKYGYVDLVVARHILEHAPNTLEYISLISALLKPGGYIFFEVPDCSKQLRHNDYTMPWEEHILYFVPETLKNIFNHTEFEIIDYKNYEYPTENSQVVILKKSMGESKNKSFDISNLIKLAEDYSVGYENQKHKVITYLQKYNLKKGKIAFYGAGHLAVMIIAIYNLENFIEFIVDDTNEKHGYYLPGTKLVIKPSSALLEEKISLCILCLSVENQSKVLERNKNYIASGGKFLSIFPVQENSLISVATKGL